MDERAAGAVAGQNIHAVFAAFERVLASCRDESAFGFFRAVAAEAGGFQDGPDVAGEIHLSLGGRRQFGSIVHGHPPPAHSDRSTRLGKTEGWCTRAALPTGHAGRLVPSGELLAGGRFISIEEERLSVGAVNRGVATGRPTGAEAEERSMVHIADINDPLAPRVPAPGRGSGGTDWNRARSAFWG
jgi:hypothetical protein